MVPRNWVPVGFNNPLCIRVMPRNIPGFLGLEMVSWLLVMPGVCGLRRCACLLCILLFDFAGPAEEVCTSVHNVFAMLLLVLFSLGDWLWHFEGVGLVCYSE